MKVASIVPVPYVELLEEKEYHLCLAHLMKDFPEYKEFYKQRASEGKYVILDNGAAEGQCMPVERILELANEIGASEIVLPDVIGDMCKTLDMSYRALHYVKAQEYKGKVMAVAQGSTMQEWVECAKDMMFWPIHTIGVPKHLTYNLGPYARIIAIGAIAHIRTKELHLLGCAYDPREVGAVECIYGDHVRGVDSSLPYLFARDNYVLKQALENRVERSQDSIDFTDSSTSKGLLATNIVVWEELCNGYQL